MRINDLVKESFETARDKGWWEMPPWFKGTLEEYVDATLGEKIGLIHSEITEMWEECDANKPMIYESEGGKPEGIAVEAADVLIRIGDYCGARGIDAASALVRLCDTTVAPADLTLKNLYAWLRPVGGDNGRNIGLNLLHARASAVLETWRKGGDLADGFAWLVRSVVYFCRCEGLPLLAATERKLAFNKTRPHRHGGKRA